MIFQERKTEKGFDYKVEDIFGVIEIQSKVKMDAKMLDSLTVKILAHTIKEGKVEDIMSFTFRPKYEYTEEEELAIWRERNKYTPWERFIKWLKKWYN